MGRLYQLTLTNPCQENWDLMTPNERGRHCDSCAKIVIDFTNYTDDQIADYFISNSGQSVCGHFKKQQVDRIRIEMPETVLTMRQARWKRFLVVCMLVFGTTIFPFETVISQTTIATATVQKETKKKKKKSFKYNKFKLAKIKFEEIVFAGNTIMESCPVVYGFTTMKPLPSNMIDPFDVQQKQSSPDTSNISFVANNDSPTKDETPERSPRQEEVFLVPASFKNRRSKKKKQSPPLS